MGYKTEFTTHIACTTERKMQHDKSQTYFDKGALENIQPKTKVVYPEKINRLAIPINVKGKVPSKNRHRQRQKGGFMLGGKIQCFAQG